MMPAPSHCNRRPVECAVCHGTVATLRLLLGRFLETHGPANDPCPGSRLSVPRNEERLRSHDDPEEDELRREDDV